jgi:uncharacterized membrane protein (UPF0136 family)
MGIGHVRYPTAGCNSEFEAQPFFVNSPFGIALAHNGNLTNSRQLAKEIKEQDYRHLNTTSDSEVLLNVFSLALRKQKPKNLTAITAFLTLTRFVFSQVVQLTSSGKIFRVENGPGIAIFGIDVIFLNIGAVVLLVRKIRRLPVEQRKPLKIVLTGIALMLSLIIIFNFALPAFLDDIRFIPFVAVQFPLILITPWLFTTRHHGMVVLSGSERSAQPTARAPRGLPHALATWP